MAALKFDDCKEGMRVKHLSGHGGGMGAGTITKITSSEVHVLYDRVYSHVYENDRRGKGIYDRKWFEICAPKGTELRLIEDPSP